MNLEKFKIIAYDKKIEILINSNYQKVKYYIQTKNTI